MQLKFSMLRQGERYTFNTDGRLGNGEAHIKNWSLIYRTPNKPRLAPAYDLVHWAEYLQRLLPALGATGADSGRAADGSA